MKYGLELHAIHLLHSGWIYLYCCRLRARFDGDDCESHTNTHNGRERKDRLIRVRLDLPCRYRHTHIHTVHTRNRRMNDDKCVTFKSNIMLSNIIYWKRANECIKTKTEKREISSQRLSARATNYTATAFAKAYSTRTHTTQMNVFLHLIAN